MNKIAFIAVAAALATNSLAGPVNYTTKAAQTVQPLAPSNDCWAPGPALGLFGGGMLPRSSNNDYCGCSEHRADGLGAGLLGEYFITENFGIQASYGAYAPNPVHHVFEGDFILRFPIRSCNVAPYLMAGGGGVADGSNRSTWNVGIGIEARFESMGCMGIFADGSYHFDAKDRDLDFTLVRVGVKMPL